MKPNIQKVGGLVVCTRCLRNLRKHIAKALTQQQAAPVQPAAPVQQK